MCFSFNFPIQAPEDTLAAKLSIDKPIPINNISKKYICKID